MTSPTYVYDFGVDIPHKSNLEGYHSVMIKAAEELNEQITDVLDWLRTNEVEPINISTRYVNILDYDKNPDGTKGYLRTVIHARKTIHEP